MVPLSEFQKHLGSDPGNYQDSRHQALGVVFFLIFMFTIYILNIFRTQQPDISNRKALLLIIPPRKSFSCVDFFLIFVFSLGFD